MSEQRRRDTSRPVELRNVAGGGMPVIVGYAAVFYKPDDPGTRYRLWHDCEERIMPGAFDRALRECDPLALFNHGRSAVLGRLSSGTLRLSVDERGLRYEIDPPDTNTGREVVELVKRGDVRGSSFAFIPKTTKETRLDAPTADGVRYVLEVIDCDLFDVGPVTEPAYAGTEAGVRLAGGGRETRDAMVRRMQAAFHRDMLALELAICDCE